ncbi:MAG: family 1 glycosylhydrolase, partial [Nitrospiraceae bacterium]|nr:family 1 glycosylhydrolase [Nitrospiraceae bacterium]
MTASPHPNILSRPPLELWGGVECTLNRVGDRYFDQVQWSGHGRRLDDLDRFAQLGIRALRYPVLWEHVAPDDLSRADWRWADERLGRLRELGIRPIVGLVHHGSGPPHTSLADVNFAEGLAQFAAAVAERYPWIEDYTPVNEPLTTARFSGLYGHWYPHGRDDATFVRVLLNQCRAIVLSMQAIRCINPTARLIQTEDLGTTFSTPLLAYQAELENARRLLSFDLLCGLVDRRHVLWKYLRSCGADEAELNFFQEAACEPDVIGINYYLTSDRLLDERLERYPAWSHGGNNRHAYADIEAVRVWADGISGHRTLLQRVWERYHRPVAITEAHLGCTREEQLRWLAEAWEAAVALRSQGTDVRAVTVWSLLGAYDWNSLVVKADGYYEPGVFDVRGPHPRPTALASMMTALSKGDPYDHPVLATPGW